MNAVGDMTDRHLLLRPAGKQRLENMPADMAVQAADAEALHRCPHGQIGHIERLVSIVVTGTAQREEFVQPDAGLGEKTFDIARIFAKGVGRESVEPGCYGRVGGKNVSCASRPQCLAKRQTRAPHMGPRSLENRKGAMTLVQVTDLDLRGERLDRPPSRDPEDNLL